MGSSGAGRISDYPGSSSGGTGGGEGGAEDRCGRAFKVQLEDVEASSFFQKFNSLPAPGEQLVVAFRKRVVALTQAGDEVGNLPTSHNYLAACIKDGWIYSGTIQTAVSGKPVAKVTADFAASR